MDSVAKNLPANLRDIRDIGSIPGSGRSPGGRHGNPLQDSCLENPMNKGAWQATVHGITESRRRPQRWAQRRLVWLSCVCPRAFCIASCLEVKSLSRVRLFATPWTVACQVPRSMGFSRQGYWSGLPFPSPGDLPDPGIEPTSPVMQADALPSEP